jgi:thiamine phosphate synthase YjbQ (UPF0047 family)
MHINATSIFINDDETGLREDFERWLEIFYPHKATNKYKHNRTREDNADAHLKRQIMRSCYFDHQREPGLCPWEQAFYVEFDGRWSKRVLVKVLGE